MLAAELYLALEVGDIGVSAELLDLRRRPLSFLRLEWLLNCYLIASLFKLFEKILDILLYFRKINLAISSLT